MNSSSEFRNDIFAFCVTSVIHSTVVDDFPTIILSTRSRQGSGDTSEAQDPVSGRTTYQVYFPASTFLEVEDARR